MRKTTLLPTLKVFLLFLVALVAGGGKAFAKSYTYDFSGSNKIYSDAGLTSEIKSGNAITSAFYTSDGKMFAVSGTVKYNAGYLFPNSNATVTLPTYTNEKIVSVVMTNTSGCSTKVNVSVKSGSDVAAAEQTWSKQGSTYTYDIAAKYQEKDLAISVSTKNAQITKIVIITESTGGGTTPTVAAPTLSLATGTYWKSQTLTIGVPEGAEGVQYTLDGTDPKESSTAELITESKDVNITETTTVKAVSVDNDDNYSDEVSRTYTFVPSIANTQETAYTVEEVKAIIDKAPTTQLEDEKVYVTGKVSNVTSYNGTYGSITYKLDDDAFTVFGGLNIDGKKFSAKEDIEFGATVIVYGNAKLYNGTYELDKNNNLVSYTPPVAVTLESVAISGEPAKTEYTEGETFDTKGLVLTATYSDESTQNVTTAATWTVTPEALTRDVTEVTVAATYQEKTDSKTFTIKVNYTEPVEGNSIIVAEYEKGNVLGYAAMTTENSGGKFTSAQIFKAGDKYITTGKVDDILFRTETAEGTTTIQRPKDGMYVQATAAKKVSYAAVKYVWQNDGETLTAENSSYGTLQYNVANPRFTTYESKVGSYATIVDKSNVYEGGLLALVGKEGDNYYATFYSDKAVEFVDATVYAVGVGDKAIVLNEVESKQVPANTGVLIKTTGEAALYTYIESAPAIGNNLLRGSLEDAETTAPAEGTYYFYKLSLDDNGQNIGFYWGAEQGAAFQNKGGHAYLALEKGDAAVKGFSITDLETGIQGLSGQDAAQDAAVWDLQGRRVQKAVRGIYVQNGRKFIVK